MYCNENVLSRNESLCYAVKPPLHQLNSTFDCSPNNFNSPQIIRPVYDIVLFGFEADVLEIRLVETFGLVKKTVLIEASYDHHGYKKPCIWKEVLKKSKRFSMFKNVVSKCITKPPKGAILGKQKIDWKYEYWQQTMSEKFVKKIKTKSIVVFGHVDEIPSRSVWEKIATSPTLGPMPTNVAITNFHGHINHAHMSIYGAHGHAYTWGSPLVTYAGIFKATHPRGSFKNVWLVGGYHLTNYCYAGSRVLKEWTATEARPDMMHRKHPSCESQVLGCRRASFKKSRYISNYIPLHLKCSPDRFPEWWHKNDNRLYTSCTM